MATVTSKVLARTAASTSSTTLYTVPASTTAVVTSILIANTASSSATYEMLFDDVSIAKTIAIAANDTIVLDMKQVLTTTKTIKALASAVTVTFHISGVEIV